MSRGCFGRLRAAFSAAAMAALLGAVALAGALSAPAAARRPPRAQQAAAQQCPDPYPAARDPSNPLDLPTAPGADPLAGARFFVDGPRHGEAAGAIARLLAIDPTRYKDSFSWAGFKARLEQGRLHRKLAHNRPLAHRVALLEKIADQPEAQRFSRYSAGGGPGAIFAQVQKIFCHNMTADRGSIPIITTYFLYQAGPCETRSEIVFDSGHVRAPGKRDGGGHRAPAGGDAARARRDRLLEVHGPQRGPARSWVSSRSTIASMFAATRAS